MHDYYVCVTKIEHSEKNQSLQITNQIFIDDFEQLLRKRYDESIVLGKDENTEQIEAYMKRYIEDKLKITVNNQVMDFNFLGKTYKDDMVISYLEIENINTIKSIKVQNTLLFDIFSTQQNIVRLKMNTKNHSFLLIPENDKCELNF